MSFLKLIVLVGAVGVLFAGGDPSVHPIAVAALAVVAYVGSRSDLNFSALFLGGAFLARAAMAPLGLELGWETTLENGSRSGLQTCLISAACVLALFAFYRVAPSSRLAGEVRSRREQSIELSEDSSITVSQTVADASEMTVCEDSDFIAGNGDSSTRHDQPTEVLFPPSAAHASPLTYDVDPDEVLGNVGERLSPLDWIKYLQRADIIPPESLVRAARAGESTANLIESMTASGVLTRYQAVLIATGLSDLLQIGDYEVLDRIGRGGMAIVLKVRDRLSKHVYAMKLLADHNSIDDVHRNRFLREMDAVCNLAHPNIAVARGVGHHRHQLYIVMEYVQGTNLARHVCLNGPLPPEAAVRYIRQAAAALGHAHQRGLVHRDIKPANLILGPNESIKLVDLGLARYVDALEQQAEELTHDWRTAAGHLMGTIDYMAPEQALDLSTADQRSDIYSLGCTMFYLLSGESHLRGKTQRRRAVALVNQRGMRTLRDACPDLPQCIYSLVSKMMNVDPSDRYQSIAELTVAINACANYFGMPDDSGREFRVLVVEDSRTQTQLMRQHLRATSQHFIPVDVRTLQIARERLQDESFDLVLLDLNLPDSQGVGTITRVREVDPSVPVLVLTSNNDPALGVQCIEAGADDYLPKDVLDVSTLERHILLTLSRREVPVA